MSQAMGREMKLTHPLTGLPSGGECTACAGLTQPVAGRLPSKGGSWGIHPDEEGGRILRAEEQLRVEGHV